MKKFLAILLIAIVACEAAEEFDLQGFFDGFVKTLKDLGIYDTLIQKGKEWAKNLCVQHLDETICELVLTWLCSKLGI